MKHTGILISSSLLFSAIVALAPSAQAEDDEAGSLLKDGFGPVGSNLLRASFLYESGDRLGLSADGDSLNKESYSRLGAWVDYTVYGFWDKTRFDTLVGGEFNLGLGYVTKEKADPERNPEPSSGWSPIHGRAEGAFDYALLHFEGPLSVRLVLGAGAGGEFGSSWYREDGRFYPLLLGRLQFFFGSKSGVHVAYHFVPTMTGDGKRREHRVEAAVNLGGLAFGAEWKQMRVLSTPYETLAPETFGGFVGYVF